MKKLLMTVLTLTLALCSIIGLTACGHEHEHELQSSSTMHWYKCECGDTYGYDAHIGGVATCKERTKCSTCGVEYGELGEHTGGSPTCKERAKCSTCNEEYGEIAPHNYVDAVCEWCQKEQKISFNTLTVNRDKVYGKVSNSILEFSFVNEISINGASDYIVSYDKYLSQSVETKIVPLSEGDNIIYVAEKTEGQIGDIYEITIRRRPMYTVSFNTANGSVVQSQSIEEDYFATIPANPERLGYVFKEWDYDFNKPITKNTIITANWTANTNTPYKVEYYLQNLENDNYTKQETENKTGTTDTIANAEIKTFAHFTHKASSTDSGNIAPNGSTVLKVYYTRDKYTVTFDGNGGNLASGKSSQTVKYGGSVTPPTFNRTGYTFTGYDKTNYSNISESFTVTAQWKINQYTLTIIFGNGTANKVIKQDYNTVINYELPSDLKRDGYTFNGWDKTIPTKMPAEDKTITAKWLAIFNISGNSVTGLTSHGKTLSQITIPNAIDGVSITSIGKEACYYCNKLTSVVIGDNVTSIGNYAFRDCRSLTSVKIGDNVTSIGNYAFYYCNKLTSVVIGDSVTSIGGGAFERCSSLTSVVIPDSVTSIGNYAFRYCNRLVEVYNKSTLNIVAGRVDNGYVGCYALAVYTEPYTSKVSINNNGYIIYTDGTEKILVGYLGEETELVLPNNITAINKYAFYYCDSLTSVVIPDSVESIGADAFFDCHSLTSVEIPDSVTSIGGGAFADCHSLTSIKYRGTQSQWGAINKGEYWNYDTGNYTITYNYTGN